ncbi:MAG: hypothetical protein ACK5LO_03605 [Leucobacter sp.]
MKAVARVRLDTRTQNERDLEGLGPAEFVDIEGIDAIDWDSARDAVMIPDGAQVCAWIDPTFGIL